MWRLSMGTSILFNYYLHKTWTSIPETMTDILRFSWHQNMETSTLCSCCSTTMQIQMSTMMMEEPHSTLQHAMVTLTFLGSYLSAVWKLIHRMNTKLPHFSWHYNMDTSMLCSYCLTTMQIQMSTAMMEELHSILQHSMATLAFLGSYLRVVWRLMHGINANLPHLSWHYNMDTLMLCSYCST